MNLTYKFKSDDANVGKTEDIRRVASVYKRYYNSLMRASMFDFYKTGKIPKYLPRLNLDKLELSERYKQTCGTQVKSNLDSNLSNIKNRITSAISKSSLDSDTKIVLFYINKYHLWFSKSVSIKEQEVPQELLRLCRQIFKQYKGSVPKMRSICLCLDSKVASIEKSKNSFDYWIKLSTLEKGKPIYLPIKSYHYFESAGGDLKRQIQLIVRKDKIEYGFIKETQDVKPKLPTSEDKVIGLDIGLVNLISSSSGNLYGRTLYKKLKHYDEIITNIVKKRQKNKLKNKSQKIDRLYSKVKNLIKNEVGRVLNKIIDKEKPDEIVVENLIGLTQDTTGRLSRRMCRLMNNSGLSKVEQRLDLKSKKYGFRIKKVNAAYTSQECPSCHNVDKLSRKSQRHFVCTKCGYKRNADYVGSLNIKGRRSIRSISVYTPRKAVQGFLLAHYRALETPLGIRPKRRPAEDSKLP
jgi:putative transposase